MGNDYVASLVSNQEYDLSAFQKGLCRINCNTLYRHTEGLTRDELRYILVPADVKGPDYPSETFRLLKEKEIRTHGEYRTRRVVLAARDRMEANGKFTAMGIG